ncbi:MAG: exodeoxyribonuclease VII small subunit [Nocardioidaceae bacterium]
MAENPSYEEARDELVAVVQKLETGGTSLQESIQLWERGEELARICQRWLDGARARLDAVVQGTTESESTASESASASANGARRDSAGHDSAGDQPSDSQSGG